MQLRSAGLLFIHIKWRLCPGPGAGEPLPARRPNAQPSLITRSQAGTRRRDPDPAETPSVRRPSGFRTRTSSRSSPARPFFLPLQ
jgi:hypothetical protein